MCVSDSLKRITKITFVSLKFMKLITSIKLFIIFLKYVSNKNKDIVIDSYKQNIMLNSKFLFINFYVTDEIYI